MRGEEQNREEGEMAQKKVGRREKLAQKRREEGEIGSESREKVDLPPPPLKYGMSQSLET